MVRSAASLIVLSFLLAIALPADAAPRVSFELVTEDGFPITGARPWVELFRAAGQTRVRIRGAKGSDATAIQTRGKGETASHTVVGILTRDNMLLLPGGRFRVTDQKRLKGWIDRLLQNGPDGFTQPTTVFGLTSKQLVEVHGQVSAPITFSTQGQPAGKVVEGITKRLPIRTSIDPVAATALRGEEVTVEELKGMTSGTALAAALRPLGLVFTVVLKAGAPELLVTDYRKPKESWPVGWPVEGTLRTKAPDLFKFLEVEITDRPLSEVIGAIQPRLNLPILYDQNSLALAEIEPSRTKVTVPPGRSYYKRILDRALSQAKLKAEVRMDEADQAFLWVTTIRSAKPRR